MFLFEQPDRHLRSGEGESGMILPLVGQWQAGELERSDFE